MSAEEEDRLQIVVPPRAPINCDEPDSSTSTQESNEKETASVDLQQRDQQVVPPHTLRRLKCHYEASPFSEAHRFCVDCTNGVITNFHLRYFEYFGLDVQSCTSKIVNCCCSPEEPNTESSVYISWLMVADAYEIAERRIAQFQEMPRVTTLFTLSLVKAVETHPCLHSVHLPIPIRKAIDEFSAGFDFADRQMSRKPGLTLFRPLYFPHYLFEHMEMYLHY